ncbi:MAG: 3-dehydroquinate synthase [Chlamydiales bacterium]|jgi:3-dehydroquinate synthase
MTTVEVTLDPPYQVTIGAGALARAAEHCARYSKVALLADERVAPLYGSGLGPLAEAPRLEITAGEGCKRFGPLAQVLDFLAEHALDRQSALVTLGGGTVGDLGGLAASLYKRGIAVVHLPTTLLSQVDAAVGGKTAINLDAGKNLAGTFHQPSAVFADTTTLTTLDDSDWRSGMGEVVKTALIAGEAELALLEQSAERLRARDPEATHAIVAMCVRTKAGVVASDPTEQGLRRSLNLGHTFAHGIEHAAGYDAVPHGIAVAVGLRMAVRASAALGLIEAPELELRVTELLGRLDLPSSLAELEALGAAPAPESVVAGMAHDKKGAVGAPEFVLPVRPGEMRLGVPIEAPRLLEILLLG